MYQCRSVFDFPNGKCGSLHTHMAKKYAHMHHTQLCCCDQYDADIQRPFATRCTYYITSTPICWEMRETNGLDRSQGPQCA
jgi:hypothetical protein